MKKIYLKSLMFVLMFSMLTLAAMPVLAAEADLGLNYAMNFGLQAQNGDVRDVAVSIVRYLMTFLGIIAVIIILIGGFRWMTAAGNEDKVASAKKTIIAGAIGLVIVIAAFAIVTFVVQFTNNALFTS